MFCKNCGNEVDEKAVICPKCGVSTTKEKVKKPIFKKWWFWVIVGVIAIAIAGGSSGDDTSQSDSGSGQAATGDAADSATQEAHQDEIVYEIVDLQTMLDDLDANALKTEKTYQNKYVEVTGKITNFDSDGSYISIEPVHADEWNFDTVMCKIKNDEQLNLLLEKSVGDEVTVKGQVVSIGEVLGYTIKMDAVQ